MKSSAIKILAWTAVAVFGSVLCTIGDHLHVINGVLTYPRALFWQEAWWVPWLFAWASLVMVAGARPIRRAIGGAPLPVPTPLELLGDSIIFMTAYAFTAYGHTLPNVVAHVLFGFWLGRMLQNRPRWFWVYAVLSAIGGCLFEASWSKLGFFRYTHPDIIGVPRWLAGIYLNVAFIGAKLERYLRRHEP